MTKIQAQTENKILTDKEHVRCWDDAEDADCRRWFGRNYIGQGFIRCEFCKNNAVQFKGYFANHVCAECKESL